jgi:predicted MFS family arabinose efflux permease
VKISPWLDRWIAGSLTSLTWLTLGAFAIGTEGFMIAGLLPAPAHDRASLEA